MELNTNVHVVTIVKDDLLGLTRTISSLRKQNMTRGAFRVLIIDSSRNQKIKNYISSVSGIQITYFYTEPAGVYSAMNTAIQILSDENIDSRDSVIFLNAGDFLMHEYSLSRLRQDNESQYMSVCHAVMLDVSRFPELLYPQTNTVSRHGCLNPLEFWLPHQGLMVNWLVFNEIGKFNTEYRIAADYDWIIRAEKIFGPIGILQDVLVAQVIGGLSNIKSYSGYKERKRMAVLLKVPVVKISPVILFKMFLKEMLFSNFPSFFEVYNRRRNPFRASRHGDHDGCAWCSYLENPDN